MSSVAIKCFHEKTRYSNGQNGFTVATYKTDDVSLVPTEAVSPYPPNDGRTAFSAVGNFLPTSDGAEIELVGSWVDGKYGKQLKVESCTVEHPKTIEGIVAYLASDIIKGIGPVTAQAIVDKFGVDTLDVIDKTPERLLDISGISEKKYRTIMESYKSSTGLRDIMTALADYGVTPKKAEKIFVTFGAQAVEVVKANPYALCRIHGFGFNTVDQMAAKKGFAPDDPHRVKESAVYVLSVAQGAGHLYLGSDELTNEAMALLNQKGEDEVVSARVVKQAIYELAVETRLQEEDGRIYLPHNYFAERETAALAKAMIRPSTIKTEDGDDIADPHEVVKVVTLAIADAEIAQGITLAANQRKAVYSVITNNFSIITGGPGTGKTTVVKALVDVYKRLGGGNVAFAAPTGRASRRLSESAGDEAVTLHSALGLGIDNNGLGAMKASKVIDADLLIVDECSMIDMQLAYQLFKALNYNTKLVMVGDSNQLPSVGAGNVFREFILSGAIPVTKLDIVHRQAQTSRINLNAHSILDGKTSLLYGQDFEFVNAETPEEAADIIKNLYFQNIKEVGSNGKSYGVYGVQILSPFRDRKVSSATELNKQIQEAVNPKSDDRPEVAVGFKRFRMLDKVLETKNKGDISNGDIGRIMKIEGKDDDCVVTINFGGGRIAEYSMEEMGTVDLAYAMTIHKSQGSECPVVIIPVLQEAFVLLKRNLIYTAITRAKMKVVLVGQKKALFMAIRNSEMAARNTVLGGMLTKP